MSTGNQQWDAISDRADSARAAFAHRTAAYWAVVDGAIERAKRGPRWWRAGGWGRDSETAARLRREAR